MRRIVAFHRWLGLLAALLVLLPAVTAILMNHRSWLEAAPARRGGPFDEYVLCTASDAAGRTWLGTSEGLHRSEDGGRTFAPVALPVSSKQVNSVAFGRRGEMYVGLRYSGVLRSDDGGAHWQPLALPPGDGEVAGVAVAADGAVVIATSAGIRRIEGDASTLVPRPPAPVASGGAALRLVYDLHDGRFWGRWGVWVTDVASLAIVLLVASGLLMFTRRRRPRRGADEEPPSTAVKKTGP